MRWRKTNSYSGTYYYSIAYECIFFVEYLLFIIHLVGAIKYLFIYKALLRKHFISVLVLLLKLPRLLFNYIAPYGFIVQRLYLLALSLYLLDVVKEMT